mgnify:CR=1 FL=1
MKESQYSKASPLTQKHKAMLQKFITLGELTATVSHELKNLLISIAGYCDLMEEKLKKQDNIEQDIKEIKKTSKMAQSIFMELLNFIKGAGQDEKMPQNINSIIEDIFIIIGTAKNITFEKSLDSTIPEIPLNPQKIKQVLINIILNSIHAIGANPGIIRISTGHLDFPFGFFVNIQDNGCGMDEKTLKSLFKPFFTTKEKGTGLGLSVCRDIMEEHNGSIYIDSKLGKGSIFTLVFLFERFKPHQDIIDL